MIEVFTVHRSGSAEALREKLKAFPELQGRVNWTGSVIPGMLNSGSRTNKLAQLVVLDLKKVPIPPYSLEKPKGEGWHGRDSFHQQGRDLTNPPKKPGFWTKQLLLEDEWRLHFFRTSGGTILLLRSAIKLPKQKKFHPWIKSHRLGWKLSYTGGAPKAVVSAGRKAIAALSLDFGAVDIGVTSKGSPVVLEVNTCPGLEGKTLDLYVSNIVSRFSRA